MNAKTLSAVFPIILKNDGKNIKILLHRRQNTGYQDGKMDIAGSGHVDEGETARIAVVRECKEESNQIISGLKFVGLAKYTEMNAVIYYTFLKEEEPFIENNEIKELIWWKPGEEIGETCSDSMKFIELYREN